MKLNLVKITPAELPSGARMVIALKEQPFAFLWYQGDVLMNRKMKGIRKLTAAMETMWRYDEMKSQEALDEADAAYDIIKQTAGDHAARQALDAWRIDAEASRKARAKAKALEWIQAGHDKIADDTWNVLDTLGYDYGFLYTGLHDAYRTLHDKYPDRIGYRDYLQNWAKAAFAYGFQMGQQAASREVEV